MSLPAASRLLRRAVLVRLMPAANHASKPAQHKVGAAEQTVAMTVLFTTILGPSGWILAHLEDYKNKK